MASQRAFKHLMRAASWSLFTVLLLGAAALWAATPGTWSPKANLNQARAAHMATLLNDGRVLIVGGKDANGAAQPNAELFDPATGLYSPVAMPLPVPVWGHTATLLSNGAVLIAGGRAETGTPIPYAQLFDPSTSTFLGPRSLASARSEHTATVLKDNRVVLAGGTDGTNPLADLELYDPLTDTFSLASAHLQVARKNHTTTLLDDGKVLVAGGADASGPVSAAELYDPEAGTVLAAGSLSTPRTQASAALLLDGTVLLAGGQNLAGQDLNTAELYDPASNQFTPMAALMSTPRSGHVGLRLQDNGRVILAGGTNAGQVIPTAELYDPLTQMFLPVGAPLTARTTFGTNFFAVPYTGGMLATGGQGMNQASLASSELFSYPTLRTDRQDYPPGYTVRMMGEGWQPNETITILVHENNGDPDATMTITADGAGTFSFDAFQTDAADVGFTFVATATGPASGWTAQAKFTDAKPNTVTLNPTTFSVNAGAAVTLTYAVTVNFNGNSNPCTSPLSISPAVPAGWTFSFTPSSLTSTGGSLTSNLQINTSAATPPSTYSFTVTAGNGAGCQSGTATASGSLILLGPVHHFSVTGYPSPVTVGSTNSFTVKALDVNNNVVVGFAGTVHFTSSDGAAGLPGDYTFMPADNGVHTFSATLNSAGTRSITATSGSITGSQSGILVNKADTSTALVSVIPSPAVFGQTINFTVNVTVNSPGSGTPTGTVELKEGSTTLATGSLSGGTVTIPISNLSVGTHGVKANYLGDSNFNPSATVGGATSVTVNKASTTTTITAHTPDPSIAGNAVAVNFSVSVNSPGAGTPTGNVTVSDGTVSCTGTVAAGTCNITFTTAGTKSLIATYAGDTNFNGSISATVSHTVNPSNTPPTVAATNASVTFNEGLTATNGGTYWDANAADNVTITASVGSVSKTGINSGTWSWSFATTDGPAQSQTVTITADDGKGGVTTTTFSLTVNNVAPTATFNAPSPVNEGTAISLSLTGASDASTVDTGAGFKYAFDCGDGSGYGPFSGTSTASCPTSDNGTRSVKGKVKDKDDGVTEYTANVTINNLPPTVTPAANQTADEGTAKSFSLGSFTDPGTADNPWAVDVDWGDGSSHTMFNAVATGTLASKSHAFPDNGPYTVTVKVTDKDGGSDTKTFQVIVANLPPTATINGAPATSPEGTLISLTSTVTDPSPVDTAEGFTKSWNVTKNGNPYASGTAATINFTPDDNASYVVTFNATDKDGGTGTDTKTITVLNVAPTNVTVTPSASPINENGSITLAGSFLDPGILDTHTIDIDWGDGSAHTTFALAAGVLSFVSVSPGHQYLDDNPSGTAADSYKISVSVTDKDLGVGSGPSNITVTVNNVAPVITTVTGPTAPLSVNSATATITANFTDVGSLDTHTCIFSWDDSTANTSVTPAGTGNGTCSATHPYTAAGVYEVHVTVTDDDTGSASSSFQYVVVYDPNGGFVTGGGWIMSPVGAYVANTSLTGKANFGFVSKYQKGATIPVGETEFQFQVANFNFHSSVYEWLVVSGPKAQYKGSGTVNGTGDYGFLLTATDGQVAGGGGVDKFRIKIWDKTAGGTVVYDNVPTASDDIDSANPQAIGGGSIVVHK